MLLLSVIQWLLDDDKKFLLLLVWFNQSIISILTFIITFKWWEWWSYIFRLTLSFATTTKSPHSYDNHWEFTFLFIIAETLSLQFLHTNSIPTYINIVNIMIKLSLLVVLQCDSIICTITSPSKNVTPLQQLLYTNNWFPRIISNLQIQLHQRGHSTSSCWSQTYQYHNMYYDQCCYYFSLCFFFFSLTTIVWLQLIAPLHTISLPT